MNVSLSPFASENLVSRDRFGSPVPRQPAHLHTQDESGTYLRDSSRFPRRRPLKKNAIRHRVSPEFIESRKCVRERCSTADRVSGPMILQRSLATQGIGYEIVP